MGLTEDKASLRSQIRAVRSAISAPVRKEASDSLAERLFNLPAVRNAHTIAVYQAMGSEIPVVDLVKALRLSNPAVSICYPACYSKGMMVFVKVEQGENPLFMQAPAQVFPLDSIPKERIVPLENIELMIVPGVAFDEGCRRLGQGGGFYDRILPKLKPECLTLGVAFDEQIVPKVPNDVHDKRVDYVVTPSRIIQL